MRRAWPRTPPPGGVPRCGLADAPRDRRMDRHRALPRDRRHRL